MRGKLLTIASFVVGLLLWEGLVRFLNVPVYVVPAPSGIAVALYRGLNAGLFDIGGYYYHFGITAYEALLGLAIGSVTGIVLGALISQIPFFERTLLPWILAIMSVPKIALAPLFVVWFGLGLVSKVVMVVAITFFPVLINAIVGFRSASPGQIELMRSCSATSWQIFRTVKMPNALPYIFAGLNLAAILSILGALVGEFVGARAGLGSLIIQMNNDLDMRGVFSVLVILAGFGLALHYLLSWLRRRFLFWVPEDHAATGL
jgi:NitT/TauT family transport system permease protein